MAFEGGEGVGKSTQITRAAAWLRAHGHDVLETREPGGTPLGRELRRRGPQGTVLRMLNKGAMRREATRHFAELQIGIRSMAQPVENLSGGQRQGVAVARAATWARRVVIMDEPTAALGVKETRQVLDLIKRVRDRGLPVILISHDMPNVFELADRIQIMRLGRRVAIVTPQTYSMSEAVAIMTGATAAETDRGTGEPT